MRKQEAALNLTEPEHRLLNQNWRYVNCDETGPLESLVLDSIGFKTLGAWIEKEQSEVMIFDNFGRVFPGEETKEDAVKSFFQRLRRLRSNHKCLRDGVMLFLQHPT